MIPLTAQLLRIVTVVRAKLRHQQRVMLQTYLTLHDIQEKLARQQRLLIPPKQPPKP